MKKILPIIVMIILVIYLTNASWLAPSDAESREILAHRGLYQTFDPHGVKNDTCTASVIDVPRHSFIENTLPSIQAAIDLGADIIEFDVHPTTDNEFVVFHDWTLGCRTNGKGVVRTKDSNYLKSLDVGYGYTADGGKTFPFRGKFVGQMPTLRELLQAFPSTKFMINVKSNSAEEAVQLTDYLNNISGLKRDRLSLFASEKVVNEFKKMNRDIQVLSRQKAKSCMKKYVLLGWSGFMPQACENTFVVVPENYQWIVWGWPNRFEARLKKVGSRSILFGPHRKGKANSGIDSKQSIKNIHPDFGGIVFTNRIDLIGSKN